MWLFGQQMNSYMESAHPMEARLALGWVVVAGIVVVLPLAYLVFHAIAKRVTPAAAFAAAGATVFVVLGAYFMVGISHREVQTATEAVVYESDKPSARAWTTEPRAESPAMAPVPTVAESIEAAAAPAKTIELRPAPAERPEPPIVKTSPPSWMTKAEGLSTDDFGRKVYRRIVHTDPFVTRGECERDLAPRLDTAVREYLIRKFGDRAQDTPPLDRQFIHNNLVRGEWEEVFESPSVGPMRQLHVLVEFDQNDDAQLAMVVDNNSRTRVSGASRMRAEIAATIAGMVLGAVAVLFAFLKIDAATKGQYRKTLGIAAVSVVVLGGVLFVASV